ncbi:uncharacterized protein BYT42DRAFT_609193 [Radiomyces spectabilis]|uniref:uncharacterized protein n=1 Tax=Radiomyces spectabilis TaxID=64574 RepID=UPI0022212AF9|nr:uncharacterized protein BYT42DRAFT_609193 [Radiomyces spectabilis]KAI8393397.1 hypothetical protein BYT42DRAFT_609193 [Radiomyces spectabilis]
MANDPYANEYPPPLANRADNTQQHELNHDYRSMSAPRLETVIPPSNQHDSRHANQFQHDVHASQPYRGMQSMNTYYDPQAISLEDFRRMEQEQERAEQNGDTEMTERISSFPPTGPFYRHPMQPSSFPYNETAYGIRPSFRQRTDIVHPYYSPSLPYDYPKVSRPMMVQPPHIAHFQPARPLIPLPSHTKRPHHARQNQCCLCHGPSCSWCSCLCFIVAMALLAAGIAMLVSNKKVARQCAAECVKLPSFLGGTEGERCNTVCGKVAHQGFLYGGIATIALAGISMIWIMISCMRRNRRRI